MTTQPDSTVFVVDDDEAMREGLSLLLSAVNLKVKHLTLLRCFWIPMTNHKTDACYSTCRAGIELGLYRRV